MVLFYQEKPPGKRDYITKSGKKASLWGLAFVVVYLIGLLQGADPFGHLANHDFQEFYLFLQVVNPGTGNEERAFPECPGYHRPEG